MARTIADVQADITKLQGLWSTAQTQYEARRAALSAEVDQYVAQHQSAADDHAAEIKAANELKSKLVPIVAGAETLESFMLTMPWYRRLLAFFGRNWRWFVYGSGLTLLVWVGAHLHK